MGRRAFSLIETMVSLFLMSIVLVMLGELAREYRRVSLASSDQEASTRTLETLRDLASDLRQAWTITTPGAGAQASQLVGQVFRADAAYLPGPGQRAGWATTPAAGVTVNLQVRRNDQGELVRQADGRKLVLLDGVEEFKVSRDNAGQFTLTIRQHGQDTSCRVLSYRAGNL